MFDVVYVPLIILIFILFFYRPAWPYKPHENKSIVYSPASGTVKKINIKQLDVGGKKVDAMHFVIILNILNMHRQYSPIYGQVLDIKHLRTKIFDSVFAKSQGDKNERVIHSLVMDDGRFVQVQQIAGKFTQRISYKRSVGDKLIPGTEIGMILLGSRVDVYVELRGENIDKVRTSVGRRVRPGTVLMELNE